MQARGWWTAALSVAAFGGASFAADGIKPIGPEIVVVDDDTAIGARHVVAGDDGGDFVMAWTAGARIDAANAVAPLPELIPDQGIRAIAARPAGDFVVTSVLRTSYTTEGTTSFSGRVFDPSGLPLGPEFPVHDFAGEGKYNGYYSLPDTGMDELGNFVVVWNGYQVDDSERIFARRFDATGAPLGDPFAVSTDVAGYNQVVAVGPSGNFVVAWSGYASDGSEGVWVRAFDAGGTPLADDSLVSGATPQYQFKPHIGADGSGEFVIAWEAIYQYDYPKPSVSVALTRRLASDGTPASDVTRLDTPSLDRGFDLAVDAGGGFLVAWNDDDRVTARAFDMNGAPRSRAFQVNSSTAGYVSDPVVASSGAGEFVVTWQDWVGYEPLVSHRFARRLGPPRATTKLRVKDDPDPAKRKLAIGAKGGLTPSIFGRQIDPVSDGAFLQVYGADGTGDAACIPLPAAGWTAKATAGGAARHVYTDPEYAVGPCSKVTISNRKVVKAACKAKAHPIAFGGTGEGAIAVRLVTGTKAYCSVFDADLAVDLPNVFVATNGLPAGACPAPPAPCP